MSALRAQAITSLFKDGFSIDQLIEVFEVPGGEIEAYIREAMSSTVPVPVVPTAKPAAPKKSRKTAGGIKPGAALPDEPLKPPKRTGQCSRHKDGVSPRNECVGCRREYQVDWRERRKRDGAKPKGRLLKQADGTRRRSRPTPTVLEVNESMAGSLGAASVAEFQEETVRQHEEGQGPTPQKAEPGKVYSHPMRCPKCTNTHRFWKRANADDSKDHWISNSWATCPNTLKIANWQIKVDRHYHGGEAA